MHPNHQKYNEDLCEKINEIVVEAANAGESVKEKFVFTELVQHILESEEILDEGAIRGFRLPSGELVDILSLDEENPNRLKIVVVEYFVGKTIKEIDQAAVKNFAEKGKKQLDELKKIKTNAFYNETYRKIVEINSSTGFTDVTISVVTNGSFTKRIMDDFRARKNAPVKIKYEIIPISELYKLENGGEGSGPYIHFGRLSSKGLHCIKNPNNQDKYNSWLAIIPGEVLYEAYRMNFTRLLESNVRAYLDKTKSNKGIHQTLKECPENFFAFNNGLTITGSEIVEIKNDEGETVIESISDMQIVNGGQTTASIYEVLKNMSDDEISNFSVAAKIIEFTDKSRFSDFVKSVSKYSNTQNKVSESDIHAGEEFHVKIEKLFRELHNPTDSRNRNRWFYERMRGQYKAEKRKPERQLKNSFESEFPQDKTIDKVNVARWMLCFDKKPHIACTGDQKGNLYFTKHRIPELMQEKSEIDASFVKKLVSYKFIFSEAERLSKEKKISSLKKNVINYAISLVADKFDINQIWERQKLQPSEILLLSNTLDLVRAHFASPSVGTMASEYAKKLDCWNELTRLHRGAPVGLERENEISV